MRELERTPGGQLDEPDARFAIELVLRASPAAGAGDAAGGVGPAADAPKRCRRLR
jgi:hypothetical protein